MAMYLFIYTLIGVALLYYVAPKEPTLFKHHFYPKAIIFILAWPLLSIPYILLTL